MSTKGIEEVLSRAMSDNAFADALFADAKKSLTGFDLTAEEIAQFNELKREDLDGLIKASPEERKSFGWNNHNENMLASQ